jgi:glyoxylase-like metal-dependent hydrolase (beta-lactamase superfamily II)
MSVWSEVGPGVFVRRYAFFDQNITAVVGAERVLVVDTRSTYAQARELQDELRTLTALPWTVLNTHHHFDHTFGNALFLPADLWGHERCAQVMREDGDRRRAALAEEMPDLASALAEVRIVPPNRTFAGEATIPLGGREAIVRFLGRGHTDNDVVTVIPDAAVVLAGDLIEEGAPPYFGDGFPLDWPGTLDASLELVTGPVVPGHGAVVDRAYAQGQAEEIRAAAHAARDVHAQGGSVEAAAAAMAYPDEVARTVAERTFAQLEGAI